MKPSKILYGPGGATLPTSPQPRATAFIKFFFFFDKCIKKKKTKKIIGYSLFHKQRIPKLKKIKNKKKKTPKHTNKYAIFFFFLKQRIPSSWVSFGPFLSFLYFSKVLTKPDMQAGKRTSLFPWSFFLSRQSIEVELWFFCDFHLQTQRLGLK